MHSPIPHALFSHEVHEHVAVVIVLVVVDDVVVVDDEETVKT